MKNTFLLVLILPCFCGCFQLFETEQIIIGKYPLKNGESVELWSVGSGATDVDNIWVLKKKGNQETKDTVCNLLGFNERNRISVKQLDDSMIRIALFDTSRFASGDSFVRIINLNRKFITYR